MWMVKKGWIDNIYTGIEVVLLPLAVCFGLATKSAHLDIGIAL